MSLSAEYHARTDAEKMSLTELASKIEELQNAREWKGDEFEDVRVRHKQRTRLNTFKEILIERLQK